METLANALNSGIRDKDRLLPFSASVCSAEQRSLKLVRSYPEVVSYMLKKHGTEQKIGENDAAILRCCQTFNMTAEQSAHNESPNRARLRMYTTKALSKKCISKTSTRPSGPGCAATGQPKPQVGLSDIGFETKSSIPIRKDSRKTPTNNYPNTKLTKPHTCIP